MKGPKKRQIEDKERTFQEQWTEKYFFVAHAEKALCLICKKNVPVMRGYNLKRHFEKKSRSLPIACWRKENTKNRKITKRIYCLADKN